MKIKFLCLCVLSSFASISPHVLATDIGSAPLEGDAVEIMSQAITNDIVYVNANLWKKKSNPIHQFDSSQLKKAVIDEGKRFLIDFSLIKDANTKSERKSDLQKIIGLRFPEDFLAITKYKGKLMYSPFADKDDANLQALLAAPEDEEPKYAAQKSYRRSRIAASTNNGVPNISFYLNANHKISDQECTFKNSLYTDFDKGTRNFCENPNISLIYQVTLARSLPFDTIGSSTPDAKIVRISLDDNVTGSGISLNKQLTTNYYTNNEWYPFIGGRWFRVFSSSAIAQEYKFDFSTSNQKPQILRTLPRSNLNANYNTSESSGFEYGISAGVEAGTDSAKASLQASARWTQNKSFTYNTSDYQVRRSSSSPSHVNFTWAREQYATGQSLLKSSPSIDSPIDLSRIKSIGYSGFVPKMDVVYKASADTKGSTEFRVNSTVSIKPLYHTGSWNGLTYTYKDLDQYTRRSNVTQKSTFTVDWNNPVFLGGRPANLQLASFNDKCISVDGEGKVSSTECSVDSVAQSFIYDQYQRYVSALDANKCLDGENLNSLQTCNLNLTQRWNWEGDSLKSKSETDKGQALYLGYNRQSGKLVFTTKEASEVGNKLITAYTNVFKN